MPPYGPHITDDELVAVYQTTADKEAVGELFRRHSLMCFAVCNKYLCDEEKAKDAAMFVFEGLFTSLTRNSIHNFKGWLYTVCKNHCLMQLRKPAMEVLIGGQYEETNSFFVEMDTLLHLDSVEKEHKLQALESAMGGLNDKQRVCIHLFYLKRKTYEEISYETGYSIKDVKSYIQNGKRNLKNHLNEKGIGFGLALLAWIQYTA